MRLGQIKGIDIKFHISTLVIVGLVGFYAANYYFNLVGEAIWPILILVGIINGVLMLGSILFHELMHSLMAKRQGLNVPEIELYMFGGVSKMEQEPEEPSSEIKITVVGPLSSLLLGGIMFSALILPQLFLDFAFSPIYTITLLFMGIANIGLGIFNFLPAFPMDGGRILRAYLWRKRNDLISATKTAANVGRYFGYGMVAYGFIQVFLVGFSGFWLVIIGWFLASSAKNALQQTLYEVKLSKMSVNEMTTMPEQSIPEDITVSEAINQYFMKHKKPYFLVRNSQGIEGIISVNDIKNLSSEQRSQTKIADYMKPLEEFPIITSDESGKNAFKKIKQDEADPNIVIVKDKDTNEIKGYVGKREIVSAIEMSDLLFNS